jgi:hypothetical protein
LVVWGAFACATAVAVGLLRLGSAGSAHPASHTQASAPAAPLGAPAPAIATAGPRIAPRDTPLDRTRWRSIVIHHSGSPAGDASSIERQHFKQGLVGLGYHFVIGNGQGLDDGQVVVGYRWERQLPGAHVSTLARVGAQRWNDESIAICLVGNGDRHPFTERQLREAAEARYAGAEKQLAHELLGTASSARAASAGFYGNASLGELLASAGAVVLLLLVCCCCAAWWCCWLLLVPHVLLLAAGCWLLIAGC